MARKSAEWGMNEIDSELGFKFNVDLLVGQEIDPYGDVDKPTPPIIPLFEASRNRFNAHDNSKLSTII